jgi:menaquinone-dependent protoporphyrinogen oxidase
MSRPVLTLAATHSVVVGAASRHGVIRGIADRIARDLAESLPRSWSVTRSDLSDLRELDGADAVVLGSAVYDGHWLHSAGRALEHLSEERCPHVWLFSNAPISSSRTAAEQIISADAMTRAGTADEHVVFSGDLDDTHLSLSERLVVDALRALRVDHRRWEAVDAWATCIAGELLAGRPLPAGGR